MWVFATSGTELGGGATHGIDEVLRLLQEFALAVATSPETADVNAAAWGLFEGLQLLAG